MYDVLVICHGNVNRSPAAEAVLRKHFPKLKVVSAGFRGERRPAAKKMREEMARRGYDLTKHRARPITQALVDHAKLVVFMDRGNWRRWRQYGFKHNNVQCLAKWIGENKIKDPAFIRGVPPEYIQIVDKIVTASMNLGMELVH